MTAINQSCQVCCKTCLPLRCTNCRTAIYCSVGCQKVDWKRGHRQTCKGTLEKRAERALNELFQLAHTVSVHEAEEHYKKTIDEVARQKNHRQLLKGASRQRQQTKSNQAGAKEDEASENSQGTSHQPTELSSVTSEASSEISTPGLDIPDYFSFMAEEMKHICRVHLTLRKKEANQPKEDLRRLYMSTSRGKRQSSSLVMLRQQLDNQVVFAAEIPWLVDPDRSLVQVENDSTISLSLQYEMDTCEYHGTSTSNPLYTVETINAIRCRHCRQRLLSNNTILKVLQLPSGHWEEIADYLICYSGQPIIDFNSSSVCAEKSVAFQDSSVMCLHREDLGISVCVLAVMGYGETDEEIKEDEKNGIDVLLQNDDAPATVRGNRSWKNLTGGATVCCSQCCAPLGFASMESPESCRLFKHRLSANSNASRNEALSSCASFLAREMVRYAEAKAIFTFIIFLDESSSSFQPPRHKKCILLRLVSWDTTMSTGYQKGSQRLELHGVAKLVFEETYEKPSSGAGSENVAKWVWGGIDLCCSPSPAITSGCHDHFTGDENIVMSKVSSVRLQLQQDEYSEVLETFQEGTKFFSKAVTEAAIMAKMGVIASSERRNIHLTAVFLDN